MTVSVYTKSNEYSVPRGLVGFQERISDGVYEGIVWFGDVSAQTVTIETDNLTHESHEGGIGQQDLDTPIRIKRSGSLTVDNCNAANVASFFGASVSTHTQDSTPITNETIRHVKPGRSWVLGNTSGGLRVRSVSSVSVDFKATARANSTAYAVGDIYVPATPNNHAYICTVAGTSGGSLPSFMTDGTTYTDGTATFKDIGTINSLTAGTDYILDAARALLSVEITGKLATVYANAVTAVGAGNFELKVDVDYTPEATTWTKIETGTVATKRGKLWIEQDNPFGANQQVVMPDCTLAPSGELPLIASDDAVAQMAFAVGINILNSATPAIRVDRFAA